MPYKDKIQQRWLFIQRRMKPEIEIDFRDVLILDLVSISALYVRGTITSATRYGFRHILHADQQCDQLYVWCFTDHKPEVDVWF